MVKVIEVHGVLIRYAYYFREIGRYCFKGRIHLDDTNHLFIGNFEDFLVKSQIMGHMTREDEIAFLKYYKRAHYIYCAAKINNEYNGHEIMYRGKWQEDAVDDSGGGTLEIYLKEIEDKSEYERVVFEPTQEQVNDCLVTMRLLINKTSPELMEEFIKSIYIR